VAVVR
jgi:hypothetical protein